MRTVDTVRATLREAIERPSAESTGGILLDCAAATEVDLTFVQLLIAARISAQGLGKEIALAASPDGALLDTLSRGGFRVACEKGAEGTSTFWFEGGSA